MRNFKQHKQHLILAAIGILFILVAAMPLYADNLPRTGTAVIVGNNDTALETIWEIVRPDGTTTAPIVWRAPEWTETGNSQWIVPAAGRLPAGKTHYRVEFPLPTGATNIKFNALVMFDDIATVSINGQKVQRQECANCGYRDFVMFRSNTWGWTDPTYKAGINTLEIEVENTVDDTVTGLNVGLMEINYELPDGQQQGDRTSRTYRPKGRRQ